MEKGIRKPLQLHEVSPITLGELIHDRVRAAIEQAVEEELAAALGAQRYERTDERCGYRNGSRRRELAVPSGVATLHVPRGVLIDAKGHEREWSSALLPRYQRRMPEINEAVAGIYVSGCNTRRLRGALRPLLRSAPLSRSAVSRVVQTLKGSLDTWQKRSLAALDVVYLYLDAFALRVRQASKVSSVPVLAAVAVLSNGAKQLVSMELCGSESKDAWKGFLNNLVTRGLKPPLLCVIDGCVGLSSAVQLVWPGVDIQRCTVHKLRNLLRKAPKHALDELKADYHRIVYAKTEAEARAARAEFVGKWKKTCPGVVVSLDEGGDELLTFFRYPESQWKTIRTTNVIERLNGEFRRRVKTQSSFPTEDAGLILLFSLIASGQIRLRRIDGYEDLGRVIGQNARREKRAA